VPAGLHAYIESVNAEDTIVWPDGFWCFRRELSSELKRGDDYRVVRLEAKEWLVIVGRGRTMTTICPDQQAA
jgi:hypothetical protein